MPVPKEIYDVYFLQSEWLANRADLEAFNRDVFSKAFRRHTMSNTFLYDVKTNEKIGEYTTNYSQISSSITPWVNVVSNNAINLFDKLIIPNISTGFIYKIADSYDNTLSFYPPRTITQDMYGHKVVILRDPIRIPEGPNEASDKNDVDIFKLRIEVYEEDF